MKIIKYNTPDSETLLCVFAGWSAVPEVLEALERPEDMDVWICYDYRILDFDGDLSHYKSVKVIAWSLGVWVAQYIISKNAARYTQCIAVNGTFHPISDTEGIPENIFIPTMENVTIDGMKRFNRRICGSKSLLEVYQSYGTRPIDEVKEELSALYSFIKKEKLSENFKWDLAIIGDEDRIFPAANMECFWNKYALNVMHINAPHYPFYLWRHWKEILNM